MQDLRRSGQFGPQSQRYLKLLVGLHLTSQGTVGGFNFVLIVLSYVHLEFMDSQALG